MRMSLAIVTTTNEGNILAADSLETYRNSIGDIREASQTRMKLFQLNSRVGAVGCGLSFIESKNIQQHVQIFKRNNKLEELSVSEVVDLLYDYFFKIYTAYLTKSAEARKKKLEETNVKDVTFEINLEVITLKYSDASGKKAEKKYYQPILEFLVAGYDVDGTNHVYKMTIPDPKEKNGIMEKLKDDQCGATWIGQTDVLVRIIRGWSPQVKRIDSVMELPENKRKVFYKELDDQEYLINWGTMTLQDAIEFSDLAIKTTESIQKITDGTWQKPGSSPGVGGEVDIAVITPENGFIWVQKKHLHVGGNSVDLESLKK